MLTSEEIYAHFMKVLATWGEDASYLVGWSTPSQVGNEPFTRWMARLMRFAASPNDFVRQLDSIFNLDAGDAPEAARDAHAGAPRRRRSRASRGRRPHARADGEFRASSTVRGMLLGGDALFGPIAATWTVRVDGSVCAHRPGRPVGGVERIERFAAIRKATMRSVIRAGASP